VPITLIAHPQGVWRTRCSHQSPYQFELLKVAVKIPVDLSSNTRLDVVLSMLRLYSALSRSVSKAVFVMQGPVKLKHLDVDLEWFWSADDDAKRMQMLLEARNGHPCLTDDLQWSEDIPLFITGKLAGLRLGPGAENLECVRAGAERVVWRIEELRESDEWPSTWRKEDEGPQPGQIQAVGISMKRSYTRCAGGVQGGLYACRDF
jgi:hypothetical protein